MQLGPFLVHLRADGRPFIRQMRALHGDYSFAAIDEIADFHVRLGPRRASAAGSDLKRRFYDDRTMPFQPVPAYMALPALEWGINWCIATAGASVPDAPFCGGGETGARNRLSGLARAWQDDAMCRLDAQGLAAALRRIWLAPPGYANPRSPADGLYHLRTPPLRSSGASRRTLYSARPFRRHGRETLPISRPRERALIGPRRRRRPP